MTPGEKYKIAAGMGITTNEAAKMLGVSRQAVDQAAARYGLTFVDAKRRHDADDLFRMHKEGMTFAEIARLSGEKYSTIQSFFSNHGIKAKVRVAKIRGPYPDPKDKRRFPPHEIKHFFGYCKYSGVIRNKKTGKPCGYTDSAGYISIKYKGFNLKAHRVAWVIHYGGWPDNVIDHINEDKTDNRIENLRDVTQSVNAIASRQSQLRASKK